MPSVLIQDQTPRNQYTATNGQTVFVYDFTLFAETDIEVYSRSGADVEPDDFEQELRLNIDYTVDLVASTITLLSAASQGQIITLVRNMPEERLNLYTNGTPITADALNTDQESAVLMAQQNTMYSRVLGVQYNKSAIIDYTNPQGGDTILPILGAGQTWAKDPTNNFIEAVTIGGGGSGNVSTLNPNVGANQGSIAVWNSEGILNDCGVFIDANDNITGAASGTFGNIRIGVTTPNTIDTAATQLDITAAAGQATRIGTLGDTLHLGGLKWPAADGTAGYFIKTDGAGNLSFASGGGGAPIASTKNNLVRFADTTGGIEDSGIDYSAGVMSGVTEIDVGNLELSGNTIAAGNTNGNIVLAPNGTGVTQSNTELEVRGGNEFRLYRTTNANYVGFKAGSPGSNTVWTLPDADGANGEVLTTNGSKVLSWAASGGGGIAGNVVQNVITATQNSAAPVFGPNTISNTMITPSSNTSRIKVIWRGNIEGGVPLNNVDTIVLYRNGVVLQESGRYVGATNLNLSGAAGNRPYETIIEYIDSPATTLPVTYAVGSISSPYGTVINPTGLSSNYIGPWPVMILEEVGP